MFRTLKQGIFNAIPIGAIGERISKSFCSSEDIELARQCCLTGIPGYQLVTLVFVSSMIVLSLCLHFRPPFMRCFMHWVFRQTSSISSLTAQPGKMVETILIITEFIQSEKLSLSKFSACVTTQCFAQTLVPHTIVQCVRSEVCRV